MGEPASIAPSTDGVFALLAVQRDLTTEKQLDAALKVQRRRSRSGRGQGLADIMVELELLKPAQAAGLQRLAQEEVIPGYRLHEEIGRGGMGSVFRATQLSMDRQVAVKFLSKRLSRDASFCAKFLQEARNAAKLNHENVVGGIDCGEVNGLHYFVMELVDGQPLDELLNAEGPLDIATAFKVIEQTARGLKHSHDQGIVHRDVKPENIMLTSTGVVKICDLGLARPARKAGDGEKGGTCEGTPYYCAPEQALGRTDIDGRADVYALGATSYHLLTGAFPFDGEGPRKILWHQVHSEFPSWEEGVPKLSSAQVALLASMVMKDRDARPESMGALLEELRKLSLGPTAPNSRRLEASAAPSSLSPVALGAGALALVALVVLATLALGNRKEPAKVAKKPTPIAKRPSPPAAIPVAPVTPLAPEPATDEGADEQALIGRQASLMLDRAKRYEVDNPKNLEVAIARYREVIDRFPGTLPAVRAQKSMLRLSTEGRERLRKSWQTARAKAREHLLKSRFRSALAALDVFRESHDARLIKSFIAPSNQLRERILRQARKFLDGALAKAKALAKAGQSELAVMLTPLSSLRDEVPVSMKGELGRMLKELTRRFDAARGQRALSALLERYQRALEEGDLAGAGKLLKAAGEDPKLEGQEAGLAAPRREFAAIERVWRAFEKKLDSLTGTKAEFPMRAGKAQRGTVKAVNKEQLELQVKVYGRKEQTTVALGQVEAAWVLGLAPAMSNAAEALATARFFIARGLDRVAALAVAKAKAFGGTNPAVLAQLERSFTEIRERSAARWLRRLKAAPIDAVLIERVRFVVTEFSDTKTYLAGRTELIARYVKARSEQLAKTPAALFKGKLSVLSKRSGKVKLSYKFDQPEEAKDFVVDIKVFKASKLAVKSGALEVTGRAMTRARFLGGALKVDTKCVARIRKRPNLNIVISDQGGRRGLLVGAGSGKFGVKKIKLDSSAPRKAGLEVRLPANLLVELNGDKSKCLLADRAPLLLGDRTMRYTVARDRKGYINARGNGRNHVNFKATTPLSQQAGAVGFYLYKATLVLDSFSIEGRLDPAWLLIEGTRLAGEEAAAFPGAPAPKGKPGQNKPKNKNLNKNNK